MKSQRRLIDLWEITPGELNWFIGAGGKTTTINRIAAELNYCKTIITTTTAILKPETIPHRVAFINSYQALYNQIAKYSQASNSKASTFRSDKPGSSTSKPSNPGFCTSKPNTPGSSTSNPGALVLASAQKQHPLNTLKGEKLTGIKPEWLTEVVKEFPDFYYLIEADGAANRPIKVPADHEPVLPEAIDNLFLLQGLSSFTRAYNKNIDKRIMHRAELFMNNNKKQDISKKLSLSSYRMLFSPRYWGYNRFKSARQIRFILTQTNSGILGFSQSLVEHLFKEYIKLNNLKSITAVNYRKEPEVIYHIDREEYLNSGYTKLKRY